MFAEGGIMQSSGIEECLAIGSSELSDRVSSLPPVLVCVWEYLATGEIDLHPWSVLSSSVRLRSGRSLYAVFREDLVEDSDAFGICGDVFVSSVY